MGEPLSRCVRCGEVKHTHYPCRVCQHITRQDNTREAHGLVALAAGQAQDSSRRRLAAQEAIERWQR